MDALERLELVKGLKKQDEKAGIEDTEDMSRFEMDPDLKAKIAALKSMKKEELGFPGLERSPASEMDFQAEGELESPDQDMQPKSEADRLELLNRIMSKLR